MAILEERGIFWWADEATPEGKFAPDSCVAGLLTIAADGRTSLELDGWLQSKHGPFSGMVQGELPAEKHIRGLLKGSGNHVLLLGLIRSGGRFSSNKISYERYVATRCLVSETAFAKKYALKFRRLRVSLEGYEEWLRLKALKVARTRQKITATYKKPKKADYRVLDGNLTIEFELGGKESGSMFGNNLTMNETAAVSLRFNSAKTLDAIAAEYQHLEEFFMLMTDTNYELPWPSIGLNKDSLCRFYFTKLENLGSREVPKYYNCIVNFMQIRECFGSLWSTWKKKREELGPGLYLFLGTRRATKMYVEHRFVNLVWGIEAFHRNKYEPAGSPPLKEKVDRVINDVKRSKDRRWLKQQLKNALEPSLGERIAETLGVLPLDLDATRLRTFSDTCARLRNDISHFGGQRQKQGSYTEFITQLHDLSEALSPLYHMLLLHELGIEAKILKWWVYEGFHSYPIKVHLAKAGLLDTSAVEPKAPQSGQPIR